MDLNAIKDIIKIFSQSDADEMHLTIDNVSLTFTKFLGRANNLPDHTVESGFEDENETMVKKISKSSTKHDDTKQGNNDDSSTHIIKSPIIETFY